MSERIDVTLAQLPSEERLSPRNTLHAVLTAVGEHVQAEPDACRVLLEVQSQAHYMPAIAEATGASQAESLASLEQLLEAGEANGDWHLNRGAALQARLLLAAIYGLMSQWHLQPGSFSWNGAVSALVNQLTSAVRPAESPQPEPTSGLR